MALGFILGATLLLNDRFTRGIVNAGRAANSFRNSVMTASNAVTALAGAMVVKTGWDWMITANADMEQYNNTLSVVLGSQEKATDMMEWATKFAAQTPFEIPGIIEATTRLSAYGISAKETLGTIGDMASVMGKDLMQAVEAVADAQTGELERLKEFGITKGMLQKQADLMGLAFQNKKGQITNQDNLNKALFAIMEKRYKGGMAIQATSFNGMLSNMQDFIGGIGRTLGKPLFDGLKNQMDSVLQWLNTIQNNGTLDAWMNKVKAFGSSVSSGFSTAYNYIMTKFITPVTTAFTGFVTKNQGTFQKIGGVIKVAFDMIKADAQPVIEWMVNDGFPKLVTILTEVGNKFMEAAGFVIDNWKDLRPFIIGVTTALVAYKAAMIAVTIANNAWVIGVRIATIAQAAWNLVMSANPIGLVILGIGLLIGALIWLGENWDTAKAWMLGVWEAIKAAAVSVWMSIVAFFQKWGTLVLAVLMGPIVGLVMLVIKNWDTVKEKTMGVWNSIVSGLSSAWESIKSFFVSGVNFVIEKINGLIAKMNEALSFEMPEWMGGGSVGVNVPTVPTLPDGSHANGLANVPFDGYLAELHKGERVLTASENRAYSGKVNPAGNVRSANRSSVNVGGITVVAQPGQDSEQIADSVLTVLHHEMMKADSVMGNGMGDQL